MALGVAEAVLAEGEVFGEGDVRVGGVDGEAGGAGAEEGGGVDGGDGWVGERFGFGEGGGLLRVERQGSVRCERRRLVDRQR